jgi:hypothetical protein
VAARLDIDGLANLLPADHTRCLPWGRIETTTADSPRPIQATGSMRQQPRRDVGITAPYRFMRGPDLQTERHRCYRRAPNRRTWKSAMGLGLGHANQTIPCHRRMIGATPRDLSRSI